MLEGKISHDRGFDVLTDKFEDDWAVQTYDVSEEERRVCFYNEDGRDVDFQLSDVIEFFKSLEAKK